MHFLIISSASSYDSSLSSASQNSGTGLLQSQTTEREPRIDYGGLDFRLTLDSKSGPPITITLVASTVQEKAAWCSDILQASKLSCLWNLDFTNTYMTIVRGRFIENFFRIMIISSIVHFVALFCKHL